VATGHFTRVPGFKTEEREAHGKKRVVGPSSGSIGEGFAYIGNRAGSEVCPVDLGTLTPSPCLQLASSPDGVQYVASAHEVWVTLPKDQTIAVLDASNAGVLKLKDAIKLDGSPECYALDDTRGVFFTNLEDKGGTLALDVKTRQVTATWSPGCGPDGPRGVVFDPKHDFVIVACTDHVQVLDAGKGGARLGAFDTGPGLDAIDYVADTSLLYAAAGKAERLSVLRVNEAGELQVVAEGATSKGARNAVADARGDVYVADSEQGRLLVFRRR
jgi:DNA-binding beta-propeller fold protein YncE